MRVSRPDMNFLQKLSSGLYWAPKLNRHARTARTSEGKKIIVCLLNTASQFMHIESVFSQLQRQTDLELDFLFLVNPSSIETLNGLLAQKGLKGLVGSLYATKFLLYWDLLITVEQSAQLPFFHCGKTICIYHGQPSKGNVYSNFNYKDIDILFFYGPMMEQYYLEQKALHPQWPEIKTYRIGQPRSDPLFSETADASANKKILSIESTNPVVLYAPSFEYCSSLFQDGDKIISTLLEMDVYLLIKPHPSIYNPNRENEEWLKKLKIYGRSEKCTFVDHPNSAEIVRACDLMITDYSGVAFDAILLDKPVIFWDCPLFFSEYLPNQYGVDGEAMKDKLYANAGRDAGIVVSTGDELNRAVTQLTEDPSLLLDKRQDIKNQLLYNRANATEIAAQTIMTLLLNGQSDG